MNPSTAVCCIRPETHKHIYISYHEQKPASALFLASSSLSFPPSPFFFNPYPLSSLSCPQDLDDRKKTKEKIVTYSLFPPEFHQSNHEWGKNILAYENPVFEDVLFEKKLFNSIYYLVYSNVPFFISRGLVFSEEYATRSNVRKVVSNFLPY